MKKHLNKVVAVLVHVIVVGAIFSIIALATVGLGWGVKTLDEHKLLSEYSVWLLTLLEHVILTLDVVGFLRYIMKMVYEEFKGD